MLVVGAGTVVVSGRCARGHCSWVSGRQPRAEACLLGLCLQRHKIGGQQRLPSQNSLCVLLKGETQSVVTKA